MLEELVEADVGRHGGSSARSHQPRDLAPTQYADHDALDEQRLFFQIHADRLEIAVLGKEPDDAAFLLVTLDGDLVLEARHHDLAAADFRGTVHGDQVSIEDARIFHAHTGHL